MNIVTIEMERLFQASTEKVWLALTDESQMAQWYFADTGFKPVVGHVSQFNVHHEGTDFLHLWKVIKVTPMKKISYEWSYEGFPGNSIVTFILTEITSDKTNLLLKHEQLDTFLPLENPQLSAANFIDGWTNFLDHSL
ncbi:MAG TPA: SRPBCC domain-containing protein, partial [Flavobacterium sp.]